MKKFLLRPALILIVLFVVLIGVIRLVPAAAEQKLFSFDAPDCSLPCVFGITPGKTTWTDYTQLMASNGPTSPRAINRGHNFTIKDQDGTRLELLADYYVSANPIKTVSYLSASTPDGKVTSFGKLVTLQNTPVRVFRSRPFGPQSMLMFFVFGSDQKIVASTWVEHKLSPDTPITFLAVFDNSGTASRVLLSTLNVDEIRWLGFGSIAKYAAAPVKP